jgi:hypothetical protein
MNNARSVGRSSAAPATAIDSFESLDDLRLFTGKRTAIHLPSRPG